MGPPGWLFCQLWDHPGVASGLPVVRPLYWPNELPGGVGDRNQGDAAAVAAGSGFREVARLSGTDRKTVRRYVDRARACGLDRDGGACQLTDELLAAVIAEVRPSRPNGKSQAWETIAARARADQGVAGAGFDADQGRTRCWAAVVWWCRIGRCIVMPQRNWGSGGGRPRCGWPTASRVRRCRSTSAGWGCSPMPAMVVVGWCTG